MPQPGQLLGDRYRLDDRIAAGGMGEVWQATDTVLGRAVAVKTLHAGQAADSGFQSRFRHEARAMALLHHPGVADVYDFGQTGDGSQAYIVMARVDGQPLHQRIADRGRLTPAETMSIVAQAGRALQAAHEAGIVHRDVKPANLIIRPDGTVVLVDFGVARSAESGALTGAKEVVGTALYIAPEQVSKRTTGPAADVYALGAVAYHCLSGHPPFVGDNAVAVALQHLQDEPPPLPADVPEPLRALVATALAKEPADRFPSAAAMAAAADTARRALPGGAFADAETALLAATVDVPRSDVVRAVAARPGAPGGDPTAAAPPGVPSGTTAVAMSGSGGDTTVGPGPGTRSGDTAILPAPPVEAPPVQARRRPRTLLITALALLLLATAVALTLANLGGLLPGGAEPTTGVTASPGGAPSPKGTARTTARPNRSARVTSAPGGPATNGTRTTTPSRTARATTPAPAPSTGGAAPTTAAGAGPTATAGDTPAGQAGATPAG